jgi:hypothetical protein
MCHISKNDGKHHQFVGGKYVHRCPIDSKGKSIRCGYGGFTACKYLHGHNEEKLRRRAEREDKKIEQEKEKLEKASSKAKVLHQSLAGSCCIFYSYHPFHQAQCYTSHESLLLAV